jgi:ribA/ribD-fused uncharacterized protein
MKYSIDWLKEQVAKGTAVDYLFFWGHTPKNPEVIDKTCFSQWYPSPFVVENKLYHTAEHWMMAGKAKLFNDTNAFSQIMTAIKPGVVKALGRTVKNFNAVTWNEHAYQIVVEGNMHKFSQNEPMKNFLLTTGNKIIVEASPQDNIWGIGLGQDRKEAMHPDTWRGTNWLGFALMEARDKLKTN